MWAASANRRVWRIPARRGRMAGRASTRRHALKAPRFRYGNLYDSQHRTLSPSIGTAKFDDGGCGDARRGVPVLPLQFGLHMQSYADIGSEILLWRRPIVGKRGLEYRVTTG
jgi:hypothetical protein